MKQVGRRRIQVTVVRMAILGVALLLGAFAFSAIMSATGPTPPANATQVSKAAPARVALEGWRSIIFGAPEYSMAEAEGGIFKPDEGGYTAWVRVNDRDYQAHVRVWARRVASLTLSDFSAPARSRSDCAKYLATTLVPTLTAEYGDGAGVAGYGGKVAQVWRFVDGGSISASTDWLAGGYGPATCVAEVRYQPAESRLGEAAKNVEHSSF